MSKSKFLRPLPVLVIVAVVIFALDQIDLIGVLKRLHGLQ